MTNSFSRTRGDLIVGFWAIAPAIAIPLLFYAWFHTVAGFPADVGDFDRFDSSFNALATWLLAGMFTAGALYLIALVVVIRDIWLRPLDQNLRIMWTILTLLFAPYAGVVYWATQCHSRRA